MKLIKTVEKFPGVSVSMVWDIVDGFGFRPRRKQFYSFIHSGHLDPECIASLGHRLVCHFQLITYHAAQKRFAKLLKTPMEFGVSTFKPWNANYVPH